MILRQVLFKGRFIWIGVKDVIVYHVSVFRPRFLLSCMVVLLLFQIRL